MKALIDADACPVAKIALKICNKYKIKCILLCDTAHNLHYDHAETFVVEKGPDSVDFALVNMITKGDIVITQDYGLASMCMAKNARILNQDGWEYTDTNIEKLLAQRHAAQKFRRAGGRTKGPKKRTEEQNKAFTIAFEALLEKNSRDNSKEEAHENTRVFPSKGD